MKAHGVAADKEIYKAAVRAPTRTLVQSQLQRLSEDALEYVNRVPEEQQFPACLEGFCGLLGATTSNWAEQVMELLKKVGVRSAPNIMEALTAVVKFSFETYSENYARAQAATGIATEKYQLSYDEAFLKSLDHDQAQSESGDNLVASIKSASYGGVQYLSTLRVGGSGCSCGTFKVTGNFCWHFAQHCRTFKLDPWTCEYALTHMRNMNNCCYNAILCNYRYVT